MSKQKKKDVIIVGAGISGLLAATVLKREGCSVQILEKSRGVGGRMATRRDGPARFDHGAQFFTVRDPGFAKWVERWETAGLVAPWFHRFPEEDGALGHVRYRGVPCMRAIGKHLAKDLDVVLNERVVSLHHGNEEWTLTTASGDTCRGRFLLLTAPVPQSLRILFNSNISFRLNKLRPLIEFEYSRCLSVLAVLDGPSGIPDYGLIRPRNAVVRMIVDNQMKGVSPDCPAITIHSTSQFAAHHWETSDEERIPLILGAALPSLQSKIVKASLHRWRYNEARNPLDTPYFFSRRHSLSLAGDGFGGSRIESAALSGLAAAEHLLDFM